MTNKTQDEINHKKEQYSKLHEFENAKEQYKEGY